MKTSQKFLFFLIIILILFSAVKISFAQERTGIGISPSCFPNHDPDCKNYYQFEQNLYNTDENFSQEFRIYNFDKNTTKEFIIDIKAVDCQFNENGLERIKNATKPRHFFLDYHDAGNCEDSNGCKAVELVIPSTAIKSGKCTLNLLAISPTEVEDTMLKVNQVIGAKISIDKKLCPLYRFHTIIFIISAILLIVLINYIYKKLKNEKKKHKY